LSPAKIKKLARVVNASLLKYSPPVHDWFEIECQRDCHFFFLPLWRAVTMAFAMEAKSETQDS
jgi:hypothetical protein